jgi:hypothetical protein
LARIRRGNRASLSLGAPLIDRIPADSAQKGARVRILNTSPAV